MLSSAIRNDYISYKSLHCQSYAEMEEKKLQLGYCFQMAFVPNLFTACSALKLVRFSEMSWHNRLCLYQFKSTEINGDAIFFFLWSMNDISNLNHVDRVIKSCLQQGLWDLNAMKICLQRLWFQKKAWLLMKNRPEHSWRGIQACG